MRGLSSSSSSSSISISSGIFSDCNFSLTVDWASFETHVRGDVVTVLLEI